MQFFFGWIAGLLTAAVWFAVWYFENFGLPDAEDVQETDDG